MLKHPKAKAFTENFTGQWLSLRNIKATTPDKILYPEFEELLQWSSVARDAPFLQRIAERKPQRAKLHRLGFRHAQRPAGEALRDTGRAWSCIPQGLLKPEYHRGGVLTHASVLKVTANGTSTSPVLRGAWVLDRILGQPAPPPPPNVPAVEPDIRGATTIREQLAKHRATETCAGCHATDRSTRLRSGKLRRHRRLARSLPSRRRTKGLGQQPGWPAGKIPCRLPVWTGPARRSRRVLADGRPFADAAGFKKLLLAHPEPVYPQHHRETRDLCDGTTRRFQRSPRP